jgi:hypothetical protein
MRTNNDHVATAFVNRQYGYKNSTGSYHTKKNRQGEGILYSYKAPIACHALDGTIYLFNGWRGFSTTTSAHLTMVKNAAEKAGKEVVIREEQPRRSNLDELLLKLHEERMGALFA